MVNLANLQYFVEVADAGSISAAAKRHFTSQQAISDHIRRLEEHFQTPLLARTRPLTLTPAGRLVYDAARRTLADFAQAEAQIDALRDTQKRVVLSTGKVYTPPFLPDLIAAFQEKHPGIEVTLVCPDSIQTELTSPPAGADLLVGNLPFDPGVEVFELFRDPVCIAMSESLLKKVYGAHWESAARRLGNHQYADLLRRVPFTLVQSVDPAVIPFLSGAPLTWSEQADLVQLMVKSGQCASVLPQQFARLTFENEPQIRFFPVPAAAAAFRVALGAPKDRKRTPEAELFLRFAREYFRPAPPLPELS